MTRAVEVLDALRNADQAGLTGSDLLRGRLIEISERGLPADEIAELAIGLARSGRTLDWREDPRFRHKLSVDLPSTGGSSNKTPIIAPLLALAAAPDSIFVPKLSSRGRVAGTIDILESVGYRATLSPVEYADVLASTGICNVVQTDDFVPADGRLMALRRQTGAMDVPALVVSSILAKNIATGCRNIVVDLKAGEDSNFGDLAGCIAGARLLIAVGEILRERGYIDGLWVAVTDGYRPEGRAVGGVASLWEVACVLGGLERGFLPDLSVLLAARMLLLTGQASDLDDARAKLQAVDRQRALSVARLWLAAQGAATDLWGDPDQLFRDLARCDIRTNARGVLLHVRSNEIARAVEELAGRPDASSSAGVLLSSDPSVGQPLHEPLVATVLGPRGMVIDNGTRESLASALVGYDGDPVVRGRSAVSDRPMILYEIALTPDGKCEREAWQRMSKAALAVIKDGETEPKYLLYRKSPLRAWNFLAGHYEAAKDPDIEATMEREMSEELGGEINERPPLPKQDFTCRRALTCTDLWWSASTNQATFYDITAFRVSYPDISHLSRIVDRHPEQLCWASHDELSRGRSVRGESITAFPAALLVARGLLGACK